MWLFNSHALLAKYHSVYIDSFNLYTQTNSRDSNAKYRHTSGLLNFTFMDLATLWIVLCMECCSYRGLNLALPVLFLSMNYAPVPASIANAGGWISQIVTARNEATREVISAHALGYLQSLNYTESPKLTLDALSTAS